MDGKEQDKTIKLEKDKSFFYLILKFSLFEADFASELF